MAGAFCLSPKLKTNAPATRRKGSEANNTASRSETAWVPPSRSAGGSGALQAAGQPTGLAKGCQRSAQRQKRSPDGRQGRAKPDALSAAGPAAAGSPAKASRRTARRAGQGLPQGAQRRKRTSAQQQGRAKPDAGCKGNGSSLRASLRRCRSVVARVELPGQGKRRGWGAWGRELGPLVPPPAPAGTGRRVSGGHRV